MEFQFQSVLVCTKTGKDSVYKHKETKGEINTTAKKENEFCFHYVGYFILGFIWTEYVDETCDNFYFYDDIVM